MKKPLAYDPGRGIPPQERSRRKKLGEAMLAFIKFLFEGGKDDEVMREVRLENYREVVEEAAAHGIETSLTWHVLGSWSNDGPDRIACFTRALACVESHRDDHLHLPGPLKDWTETHTRADCLYEIGRIHAHEGNPAIARDFLARALPLSQEAERLRAPANITTEDNLEGRIASLLLQLPDPDDPATD